MDTEKNIYQPLDMDMIAKKKHRTVSSEEALRDVVSVKWSDSVLKGERKVEVECAELATS